MSSALRKSEIDANDLLVSSIIRRSETDKPKLAPIPERTLQSYTPTATPTQGSLSQDQIFERLFQTIQVLAPEGELFVGHCSTLSQSCKVAWASGHFLSLKGRTLSVHGDSVLTRALERKESFQYFSASDMLRWDMGNNIAHGTGVVFPIQLAEETVAILGYWQPLSKGQLSRERIFALNSMVELVGQASQSTDLSLDTQAQELQLQTMRSEIDESHNFYKQFQDAINQCFWIVDSANHKLLAASDNFERVWGTNRKALDEGLTGFASNVHPQDRDRVLSEFHVGLVSEVDTEFRIICDDGEVRWIWLRAYPAKDPVTGMETSRIVVIGDDVTERKNREEILRVRESELVSRARMQAVSDLASGVAHEINNPLTVIMGRAECIKYLAEKDKDKLGKDVAALIEHADRIQATSTRISDIVLSLKSLSTKEKNLKLLKMPFHKLFTDIKDLCSERSKALGVKLEFKEFPQYLAAELNPTMASQMLLNIINNGIDAVQGLNDKWVQVDWTEDTDNVYIYVTDSGPGIPIKNRSRIFDPFFTTKCPDQGTGLGLSLAASIAAHHHGSIRLDTLHSHTRFAIQIPKKQPATKK